MKKILLTLFAISFALLVNAQTSDHLGIIPAPVSVQSKAGSFKLSGNIVIIAAPQNKEARLLKDFLTINGISSKIGSSKELPSGHKSISIVETKDRSLPTEGYKINIDATRIVLEGKNAGLFYAMQTLTQIVLKQRETGSSEIPSVSIKDYPRFAYRGMHLDVTRHYFPVSFIKKYIDILATYKLNTFHWHLTDDQGWRIEIKKYPKLTEIGAVRNGTIIGNYPGTGGTDNEQYKGYYTQREAREIVAYAAERHITVIPEIEMPGHASAAIAAYPQLSVFPDRDTEIGQNAPWSGPRTGKQVQQTFGVFNDIFAPTEYTFDFLQDVLDEVVNVFPSKYIHIGGDEAPKTYWKESEFCQALIKEKGLKDEHGLQSYFIQRIEKYLNAKGRSIIGWDEILEGGLAPNATVMSWRGEDGGIEAAKQKHDVLMTPASGGLYFDHKQSSSDDEPLTISGRGKGFVDYAKVYNYNPVPAALKEDERQYIKGVQANMWTEYMETPAKVEYMLFPKLFSLAEIAWTPLENKNYQNFSEKRVPIHLARLEKTGTNFWVPTPIGQTSGIVNGENHSIELKTPLIGARIFYTLDDYRTSDNATLYRAPIKVNVPHGFSKVLSTIVITPTGKRSVVSKTILNNGDPKIKTTK
jgi:hexosaminidase